MTTDRIGVSGRRPRFGAVAALVFLLGACSGSGAAIAPTGSVPDTPASSTTLERVDGETVLRAALAGYEPGYAFSSQVMVADSVAVRVDGRVLDGSSSMTVWSGQGAVEYLIVETGQWARPPQGAWELVAESGSQPPLEPLAAPAAVAVVAGSGSAVTLEGIYPAAAFGLSGADLTVSLSIDAGRLASARYSLARDGTTARVESTFAPLTDTTPITAPAA